MIEMAADSSGAEGKMLISSQVAKKDLLHAAFTAKWLGWLAFATFTAK